ncbi:C45 family peptidase [Bacteroidales bacterium MB20-C3-3]|nr:C45 family peptidase [Bacteroidales bacterium MB20-C3-3]
MTKVFGKILKYIAATILSLILLMAAAGVILYVTADRSIPDNSLPVVIPSTRDSAGVLLFGRSSLEKGEGDLWNLRLRGDAEERGLAFGQLCKSLMHEQERAFVDQIKIIIPNERYLSFLKYLTIIYNRNIRSNIEEEFRKEIYATSLGSSSEFDYIGSPYDRQLNYHAAHDLGHAMQEYMLVGCSSFAAWGSESDDSTLIIGRNFDFWVGDDFAKNKVVTIMEPDKGYKFLSVGWAGMSGVLSGMNEKGLTITMNAAKSSPPVRSNTPISIIAREILQYASNIEEAYIIASKRDAFVSESLLIGSGLENRAAIIEKSPDNTRLFTTQGELIISTNHFQTAGFFNDKQNKEAVQAIEGSHSQYRYNRLKQLIADMKPLSPERSARILRNKNGISDEELGLGNEMSINQYISHHSVIFKPVQRVVWVSTAPWQLGKMVKYDLNELFNLSANNIKDDFKDIPADSVQINEFEPKVRDFRKMSKLLSQKTSEKISADEEFVSSYIMINPYFFQTYTNLGENFLSSGDYSSASAMFSKALEMKLPSEETRRYIINKLEKLK